LTLEKIIFHRNKLENKTFFLNRVFLNIIEIFFSLSIKEKAEHSSTFIFVTETFPSSEPFFIENRKYIKDNKDFLSIP
jgi:hypothetical protein